MADKKGADAKGKDEKKPAPVPEKVTSSQLDKVYEYDADYIATLKKEAPWNKNVKWFTKTRVSALAAMKILKHSLSGVKKGRAGKSGMAIEVMGMLVGKPDGDAIVITDAYALPVEGVENFVDTSARAMTYMTTLLDSLEKTRKEGYVGWYHSHPFDVETKSNCFMSATDVGTQRDYQNQFPVWVAIVCDPLRSLAKQEPQFGAYRIYPVTHNPPANQAPDGTMGDKEDHVARWGHAFNRYYQLELSYFMSSLGHKMLGIMSKNNLWVRVLSSSAILEPEYRERLPERFNKATQKLDQAGRQADSGGYGRSYHGGKSGKGKDTALNQGVQATSELAIEQCKGHCTQVCKDIVFNHVKAVMAKKEQQQEKKEDKKSS
jgi:COP9 signalosome complex subunit 5